MDSILLSLLLLFFLSFLAIEDIRVDLASSLDDFSLAHGLAQGLALWPQGMFL